MGKEMSVSSSMQDAGKAAIGYLRVSTDEQANSGLGLDAQRAAIEGWARREGYTIAAWFCDEGISGGAALEDRPGILGAIDALDDGYVLAIAKRDRLARDYIVSAAIDAMAVKRGAKVVSVAGEGAADESDPAAWLLSRMIDLFAHYERLIIKARTRSALNAKRNRGEALGNTDFGWSRDGSGKLVENPTEQTALTLMRQFWDEHPSYGAVVRKLNAAGVRPRAMPWTAQSVQRVALGRPRTPQTEYLAAQLAGLTKRALASRARDLARELNAAKIQPPQTRWTRASVRRYLARRAHSPAAGVVLSPAT